MSQRVLIQGVGGLGGVVMAHLATHAEALGVEVTGVTRNEGVVRAVADRGLVLRDDGEHVVSCTVSPSPPEGAVFDTVVLATQPTDVEEAARQALPFLADNGDMVVLQNGLCEARVAAIGGAGRVVGGVVTFGASMPEPGLFVRTSPGGFVLGRPDGSDGGLRALAVMLECVGPVELTDNLDGVRWSKLAINCAISTLGTIGGDRLGALMRHRFARRLGLDVISEVVAVARAEGVRLEKVSGTIDLEWLALDDPGWSPTLVAKHGLMLAVGARYRNLRSSMLFAIERGRPPAVDFLNGEVVARAERHGIDVPYNRAAQALVHRIAAGEVVPSVETLRGLS